MPLPSELPAERVGSRASTELSSVKARKKGRSRAALRPNNNIDLSSACSKLNVLVKLSIVSIESKSSVGFGLAHKGENLLNNDYREGPRPVRGKSSCTNIASAECVKCRGLISDDSH